MRSSHVSIHLEVELGNRVSLQAPLRGVLDLVVDVLDVPVHVLLSTIHRYSLPILPSPLTTSHSLKKRGGIHTKIT